MVRQRCEQFDEVADLGRVAVEGGDAGYRLDLLRLGT